MWTLDHGYNRPRAKETTQTQRVRDSVTSRKAPPASINQHARGARTRTGHAKPRKICSRNVDVASHTLNPAYGAPETPLDQKQRQPQITKNVCQFCERGDLESWAKEGGWSRISRTRSSFITLLKMGSVRAVVNSE